MLSGKKLKMNEETSKIKKVVGIYGGRFQPFGPHHKKTYEWLKKQVDEAYIVTSNLKSLPRHPMNFKEKVRHMVKMGIPKNRIIMEKSPYKAVNALNIQLDKWNKVRKWQDKHFAKGDLEQPSKHDEIFKGLCHQETERAYDASPKGRALKLLELSAKRCKHSLNAGLPLDTAVSVIHQEMRSQKINLDLPKNVFNPMMLENK